MKSLFLLLLSGFFLLGCQQDKGTIIRMETSEGNICIRLYNATFLHRDNMLRLVREGFYEGVLFHRVIRDFMIQAGDPESRGARQAAILGDKDNGYTLKAEILPEYFHKKGALAAARESDNINPDRNSSGSHFYLVQGKVFTPETLNEEVTKINNKRYTALFNRLKAAREGEIIKFQSAEDYEALMRINRELSDATREQFEKVKLKLSPEQEKAYTTIGGTPHLDGEYTVFGEIVEGIEVLEKIAAMPTDENHRPVQDVVIRKMTVE